MDKVKLNFKRSEAIFVNDDDGHTYCIHQDWQPDFVNWLSAEYEYWNSDFDVSYEDFMKTAGVTSDFEDYMIGCHQNVFLKEVAEFLPE